MKIKNCIFCNIAQNREEKVWENDLFFALFDIHPVNPGHTLIIPKRHVVDFNSLNEKEWVAIQKAINEIIPIIEKTDFKSYYENLLSTVKNDITIWFLKEALKNPNLSKLPNAYNHGVNDGREAGRTVDHLHWQIIPRFIGDIDDPSGGVRFVIPERGNYKISRN